MQVADRKRQRDDRFPSSIKPRSDQNNHDLAHEEGRPLDQRKGRSVEDIQLFEIQGDSYAHYSWQQDAK